MATARASCTGADLIWICCSECDAGRRRNHLLAACILEFNPDAAAGVSAGLAAPTAHNVRSLTAQRQASWGGSARPCLAAQQRQGRLAARSRCIAVRSVLLYLAPAAAWQPDPDMTPLPTASPQATGRPARLAAGIPAHAAQQPSDLTHLRPRSRRRQLSSGCCKHIAGRLVQLLPQGGAHPNSVHVSMSSVRILPSILYHIGCRVECDFSGSFFTRPVAGGAIFGALLSIRIQRFLAPSRTDPAGQSATPAAASLRGCCGRRHLWWAGIFSRHTLSSNNITHRTRQGGARLQRQLLRGLVVSGAIFSALFNL